MKKTLGTALGLLLFAGAVYAQEVSKTVYVGDGAPGAKVYDNGLLACNVATNVCKLGNGVDDWNTRPGFTGGGGGASALPDLTDVDASVATPNDGDILVFRQAGGLFVLEAKPAAGSNPAIGDITDWPAGVTATEVGYLDGVTSLIQTQLDNKQATIANSDDIAEGTTNRFATPAGVTAAGAIMADGANAYDISNDSQATAFTPAVGACPVINVTIPSGSGTFTVNAPTGTAPSGDYHCSYIINNLSGATRNVVLGTINGSGERLTDLLRANASRFRMTIYTTDAGGSWYYDGGALDLSTLASNATPAGDDLMLCQDVSDTPDTWKQCRIDAVAKVENDPAPVLAGDLLVQEPRKINFNVIDVSGEIEGDIGVNGNGTLVVDGDTLDLTADALAIRANGAIYLQGAGAFDNAELRVGTAVTLNGETVYPLQFVSPPAAAHQQTATNAGPTAAITNLGVGTPITAIPSFNSDFDYQVGAYLEFRATINRTNTRDGTIWLRFLRNGSPVGTDTPFDVSGSNPTMPMVLTVTIAEANLPANGDPLEVQVWGDTGNHGQFSVTLSAITFLLQQPGAGGGGQLTDSDVRGNHSDHTTDVTVTALDHGKTIVCDNPTAMNVNVDDGTTDWSPDFRVYVLNIGAGDCTIQDGTTADVTIRTATGFNATVPQYGGATIIGKDVDEVVVTGGSAS